MSALVFAVADSLAAVVDGLAVAAVPAGGGFGVGGPGRWVASCKLAHVDRTRSGAPRRREASISVELDAEATPAAALAAVLLEAAALAAAWGVRFDAGPAAALGDAVLAAAARGEVGP